MRSAGAISSARALSSPSPSPPFSSPSPAATCASSPVAQPLKSKQFHALQNDGDEDLKQAIGDAKALLEHSRKHIDAQILQLKREAALTASGA